MSNLSELLPAGSSVKSADFVAQGTLASGVTVGLRSDGKVEAITGTSTDIGTKSAAIFSSTSYYGTSAYDINSDRYVIVFINSSGYPTAVVAQLTGTTFTFGTPVVWQSAGASYMNAIYHPDENKVVVFYMTQLGGADFSGTGIVGNVTAGSNSIAFGTAVSWMTKSNNAWSMAYDTTADRIVGHYYDNGNNNYLYGVVAAVSGTTITFGTPVVVRSVAYHSYGGTVYDAYRNKTIYVYAQDTDSQAYAGIGTVNAGSNSISYTTAQAVGNQQQRTQLTYDPVSYKTVDLYVVVGALATTKYRVITNSGTSLTFGAETAAFSESANIILYRQVYDVTNAHIVQPYVDNSDTTPGNFGIVYRTGTISGDTVTYSDKTDLGIASDFYGGADGLSCDQSNAKFVQPFRDATDSNYPKAVAFTAGATNVSSYIGITDQAISSAATGKVVCKGGAITNTGLIPFAPSFGTASEFSAANTTKTAVAFDSSNNKIVVVYNNPSDSLYATAVVGTVSGSSITYGTPVRLRTSSIQYPTATFDSTANKVNIVFTNDLNGNRLECMTGTISGTSISVTSAILVNGSNGATYASSVFDVNANRLVICWVNTSNSSYGTAAVGTYNSGTGQQGFGSPVVFNSASTSACAAVYDSNANKVVTGYQDSGNSGHGTAIVGTVSGTSISFGSEAVFESANSFLMAGTFDSNANKVVFTYQSGSKGKAVVCTVSGTSISFGSSVNFDESAAADMSNSFDTSSNKVVVCFRDVANSQSGTVVFGTVSGTSISFAASSAFVGGTVANISTTFDSNVNKTIVAFVDGSDSTKGKALTITEANDLTPNTAYFVQDDGTISTSSTSTKAGTALSTTSLLITG